MKRSRRVWPLVLVLVLAVAAAGCARVSKPSGWTEPVADNGSLYVSLDAGKLASLDASTYAEQWVFPAADSFKCGNGPEEKRKLDAIYESPAMDDTNVYIGAYDNAVYAVGRKDGLCVWRAETGDVIIGGTALGEQGLYVPSTDGYVYLLNPADGTVKNKFNTGDSWSTPLVTSDGVYVATMDGKLWKLSPDLSQSLWSAPFQVSASLLTPPTLMGDNSTLLVGGIGKKLYAVKASDGSKLWEVSGGNWFWGRPAIDGTMVYATTLDGEVIAIDGTKGTTNWTYKAIESIRSGVVVAGDTVVAVDNSGKIYRLAKKDGAAQGEPNDLKEGVYATPILFTGGQGFTPAPSGSASPTASPTPQPSASPTPVPDNGIGRTEVNTVLISTQSGHLYTFDVALGRTTEVVS